MIKYISVGVLAETNISIYCQVGELSEGVDLFYGNTAESMGVQTLEITYNQEMFKKEYLCDFARND